MFSAWYHENRKTTLGWLEHLHQFPEVGFEETETAAFAAGVLRQHGYDVACGIGGTGIVATLHGMAADEPHSRTIAFRAELDALPMTEKTGLGYASTRPGKFHGCGHDGHTVVALTAAAYLAGRRNLEGTVRFIFQPAEELLTGARAMLADGLFERFPCDEIYALHNLPGLPAGTVGVPATAALASADDINVTLRAKGSHGSMPHTGTDAIAAAAHFVTSVQQAATRVIDARDAGVISFGVFRGGTVRNVLPDEVRLEGTMRTTSTSARTRLEGLLRNAAKATELLFDVQMDCSVEKVAPVTVNDPDCVAAVHEAAARVVGSENVLGNARSLMASEDFSELCARVPGAYFFIGQSGQMPHHPEYVFDPGVIPIGAAIFADLAQQRTSRKLGLRPAH
ncbi:amidohydrolase [Aliigemmobacter aestuarii]|uniref:Amidohydrolase n=1 Tax=Aliigemmobacter aestuarii TaxID=1445661 RepID=A0A4S3MJ46_9RHOB|nr:amidohydrolase [Gemmobacter aestuarii]THD80849.1 amidohydrolase [Gemmobacter aestuarii]